MEKATIFESFFDSLPVNLGVTALAASSLSTGMLLPPLLPVLTASLAVNRQQKRIYKAIREVEAILKNHTDLIANLSDTQFQLMNDLSNITFQTYDDDKIKLLRNSIVNTVFEGDIIEHEGVVLSRVLRDVSCWEFRFLISIVGYKEVTVMGNKDGSFTPRDGQKLIEPGSNDDQIIRSLSNYNLVKSDISGFGETLFYSVTPIGELLIKLCKVPEENV